MKAVVYGAVLTSMACGGGFDWLWGDVPWGDPGDAPPVAGGGGSPGPVDVDCPSLTKTLDAHVVFGAAVERDDGYYASVATNAASATEFLGTDGDQEVTLYITDPREREWTADPDLCINSPICGDGTRNVTPEADELCEGTDLNGSTCADHGYLGGGSLSCTSYCTFDTDDCEAQCGNGIIEPSEKCDGPLSGDDSCESYHRRFIGGELGCGDDCRFDTSQCIEPVCGNGIIEQGEDCDGTTFGEVDTCAEQRPVWESGVLGCDDCRFDFSACVPKCGNGALDDLEQCEGDLRSPEYEGKTCRDFRYPHPLFLLNTTVNYGSGELRCDQCTIQTDDCRPAPGCYVLRFKASVTVQCYD